MKFTLKDIVKDTVRDIRETAADFFLERKKNAVNLGKSVKNSFEENADYEKTKEFLEYSKRKIKRLPNRLFSGASVFLLFIILVTLAPRGVSPESVVQDDLASAQSAIVAQAKIRRDEREREKTDWTVLIGIVFLAVPVCVGVKIAIGKHDKKVKMTPEKFKKSLAKLNERQDSERMKFLTSFFKNQGFDVDEITNRKD